MNECRIVVGMAGSQGVAYGVRLLEVLRETPVETHLVMGEVARGAIGADAAAVRGLADQVYAHANQAARISSGSFQTRGMIVVPCSVRSLAAISMGLATNLVYRAADVTLKEGRPLVLAVPPSSLSAIDLENIARASAVPGLAVQRLEGPVDEAVAALLDHFEIDHGLSPA